MLYRPDMNSEMLGKSIKVNPHVRAFSTKIDLGGQTYTIDSEDYGIQSPFIFTRIFHKGKILYSNTLDYRSILKEKDLDKRLKEIIEKQQHKAIAALKIQKNAPTIPYKDYIKDIKALIRQNNNEEALSLSSEAAEKYPDNPVILSYRGYLEASLHRRYADGIKFCSLALVILKRQMPVGGEFFLPTLYLNLGKAYLAANKKKEAVESFQEGIKIDKNNEELLNEMKKLGTRRKPPLPFLKRSNPVNKYIGKLTYKLQSIINSS
jgi:tetratricopeptide (TPR) repeat protein